MHFQHTRSRQFLTFGLDVEWVRGDALAEQFAALDARLDGEAESQRQRVRVGRRRVALLHVQKPQLAAVRRDKQCTVGTPLYSQQRPRVCKTTDGTSHCKRTHTSGAPSWATCTSTIFSTKCHSLCCGVTRTRLPEIPMTKVSDKDVQVLQYEAVLKKSSTAEVQRKNCSV